MWPCRELNDVFHTTPESRTEIGSHNRQRGVLDQQRDNGRDRIRTSAGRASGFTVRLHQPLGHSPRRPHLTRKTPQGRTEVGALCWQEGPGSSAPRILFHILSWGSWYQPNRGVALPANVAGEATPPAQVNLGLSVEYHSTSEMINIREFASFSLGRSEERGTVIADRNPMLRPNISGPRRAGTATSLGVKSSALTLPAF